MTVIYLVRHGQASFSADDYDNLSDKGQLQARLLGDYLLKKQVFPHQVVTGTMRRHQQTAEHSLKAFSECEDECLIRPQQDSQWNEYDHQNILGVYDPKLSTAQGVRAYLATKSSPMADFQTLYVNSINAWVMADEPNAYQESFQHFAERVLQGLDDIVQQHDGKKVVVYTSGGPISLIICHLLGIPLQRFLDINWTLVNAGVTKIVARGKTSQLMLSTMNEHDMFEQHAHEKLITYT